MKSSRIQLVFFGLFLMVALLPVHGFSQEDDRQRISNLETRVYHLEYNYDAAFLGFIFGAFCALWAQNTRRNPWLWFFLGFFFTVITVLFLLKKNSDDKKLNT